MHVCVCSQGSYSDLYPDSDDSSEDQIENSKNTWSCKVQYDTDPSPDGNQKQWKLFWRLVLMFLLSFSLFHLEVCSCSWKFLIRASSNPKIRNPGLWWDRDRPKKFLFGQFADLQFIIEIFCENIIEQLNGSKGRTLTVFLIHSGCWTVWPACWSWFASLL